MRFEKNEEYYQNIDKRTKEYKEWKAFQEKKSRGLGDDVAKLAQATGIDKVADSVAKALGYDDCGCEARKERLNKVFRYRTPECLNEAEYTLLAKFFEKSRTRVTYGEQKDLFAIYNRVFNAEMKPTSCRSCYREIATKLKRLMEEHRA